MDERDVNEDWLKLRTWDLPHVRTISDVFRMRGVAGAPASVKLAELVRLELLPFWRTAPARLKEQAELFKRANRPG